MKLLQIIRCGLLAALFTVGEATLEAGNMVPAKARASGQVTSATYIANPNPLGTPFLVVTAEAEGNGTVLGKYTIEIYEVFQLELIDGVLTLVSEGDFAATAANGDQLFGTFNHFREYGTLTFTGTATFTGGTGKFKGATGFETTVGEVAPNLIDFSYTHEGYISSVGSNKGEGH